MKVVMPAYIENATTADEIASNELRAKYEELFEELQRDYATYLAAQDPAIVIDDLMSYFQALDLITLLSDPDATMPTGWVRPQGDPPAKPKNKFYRLPLDEPYFEINTDTRVIAVPKDFQNNGLGVKGDANAEIVFFKCPRLYDSIDLYPMVEKGNCYIQWTNVSAGKSGNSQAILCDVNQEYMFLGWMITPKMTSVAGVIEFSVRWFTQEGEGDNAKITYSLSTQKASCNIKSTIDLDLNNVEIEKMEDLVKTRPIYTHIINSMEGLSPRISKQLVTGEYNLEATDNVSYPVSTYPNGIKIFEVTASSPDGKTITYQWYKGTAAITGANTGTYIATAPGTYHVIIGNGDTSGYRYITSPTVVVPAPEDIKYINEAANKYFGCGAYSNGTVLTADITTVTDKAPNGTVEVEWYYAPMVVNGSVIAKQNAVFTKINDATQELAKQTAKTFVTGSYTPTAKTEGWYKCKAVNKLNNAASAVIETEKVITVRAIPERPTSVTIIYDAENRMLKVNDIVFPDNSPSAAHRDEWHYQWNDGSEISAANGGNGFGDGFKDLRIVYPGTDAEITYNVKVSHRVYNGNKVEEGEAAGTAVQQESSVRASNNITLKFVYGGNSVPTVTVLLIKGGRR